VNHAAKYHERAKERISEAGYRKSNENIDAHHVTNALRVLTETGEVIRAAAEATRGGHKIETIQPADQRRRGTAIARAAARKRLLYARYLGWATGTKRHPHGHIGPAGEAAARTGILASGTLQPVHPDAGQVSTLLGVSLPGPLDSAGYHVPLVHGVPQQPVTVMIEVKNIRAWIYPSAEEIYQLLTKAAIVQQTHPDQQILPVFICRRAHPTAFWMAQQLGFMIIDMELQFVGHPIDEHEQAHFDEVRVELHFNDLRLGKGPSVRVTDRFAKVIPTHASAMASTWMRTVANDEIRTLIAPLRTAKHAERTALMDELRHAVTRAGHRGF